MNKLLFNVNNVPNSSNRIIPLNLDTHSLAYVLRGYPFGMLITALEKFLTAERIIK